MSQRGNGTGSQHFRRFLFLSRWHRSHLPSDPQTLRRYCLHWPRCSHLRRCSQESCCFHLRRRFRFPLCLRCRLSQQSLRLSHPSFRCSHWSFRRRCCLLSFHCLRSFHRLSFHRLRSFHRHQSFRLRRSFRRCCCLRQSCRHLRSLRKSRRHGHCLNRRSLPLRLHRTRRSPQSPPKLPSSPIHLWHLPYSASDPFRRFRFRLRKMFLPLLKHLRSRLHYRRPPQDPHRKARSRLPSPGRFLPLFLLLSSPADVLLSSSRRGSLRAAHSCRFYRRW